MFYSDGTIKVERHTLVKDGFYPIEIRKILGKWEMLMNVSANGDERWQDLPFSDAHIRKQIEKYGVKEK